MSLHFLEPNREPRKCPRCSGIGVYKTRLDRSYGDHAAMVWECHYCHGTGRLGDPDAEPDVGVFRAHRSTCEHGSAIVGDGDQEPCCDDAERSTDEWYWRYQTGQCDDIGPYPTRDAALAAARKAARGETP